MSRYIDADLIKYTAQIGYWDVAYKADIDKIPTADVREVVSGEWIETTNGDHWKCSACGCRSPYWFEEENSCEWDLDMSEWHSNYCPNCGAEMKEKA